MKVERCGWCRKEPKLSHAAWPSVYHCFDGCIMAFGIAMDLETWNKLQLNILEARRRDFVAGFNKGGSEDSRETAFEDYLRESEKD